MKELSIFIDESGDFGEARERPSYYLVTFVFHNQENNITQQADFICSLELLRIKRNEKRLSKSEERFFYKPQELKKTFLKSIDKKKL
jgi:hypothetical protein